MVIQRVSLCTEAEDDEDLSPLKRNWAGSHLEKDLAGLGVSRVSDRTSIHHGSQAPASRTRAHLDAQCRNQLSHTPSFLLACTMLWSV